MAGDFGYANARLRGRRSRLYTPEDFVAMRGLQALDDLLHLLRRGEYGPDLEEALENHEPAEAIGIAVQQRFAREVRQVPKFFQELYQPLVRLIVRRLTLDAVKAGLRGQAMGLSSDVILDLMIPTVDLGLAQLTGLANASDLEAMLDLIATWQLPYAVPLLNAWTLFGDVQTPERSLPYLDLALDTWHYADALPTAESFREEGEALVRTLRREIDVLNILVGMRLANEVGGEGDLIAWMLPGGSMRPEPLADRLYGHGPDFWRDAFADTVYGSAVAKGFLAYDHTRRLSSVARELERFLLNRAIQEYVGDPLGIGVAIGYLALLRSEAINLRVVANGLALGAGRRLMDEGLLLSKEQD